MGTLGRALVIMLIVAAFSLGVSWAFCTGLSEVFHGGMCGSVLSFVDWLATSGRNWVGRLQ